MIGADSAIENRISELKAELESTRAERDRDVELLTNRFKTENAEVERRMQKQLEDARRAAETAEKKYKKDIGESGGWRFGLFGRGKVQDADVDSPIKQPHGVKSIPLRTRKTLETERART